MLIFNPLGSGAQTPLLANATYNDTTRSVGGGGSENQFLSKFRVFVSSDQAGTLGIEQSLDGTTWYETISLSVAAADPSILESMITLPFVRGTFTNGAVNQATFLLATAMVE